MFICTMLNVKKEIKSGAVDTRIGKECRVMIDEKVVGNAKHNPEFCTGLASKVKQDMERKGYKCEEKNIK
jgi:hypothetical protein